MHFEIYYVFSNYVRRIRHFNNPWMSFHLHHALHICLTLSQVILTQSLLCFSDTNTKPLMHIVPSCLSSPKSINVPALNLRTYLPDPFTKEDITEKNSLLRWQQAAGLVESTVSSIGDSSKNMKTTHIFSMSLGRGNFPRTPQLSMHSNIQLCMSSFGLQIIYREMHPLFLALSFLANEINSGKTE